MCRGYDVSCPKCGLWNWKKGCIPVLGTRERKLECEDCGTVFDVVKVKIITEYDREEK